MTTDTNIDKDKTLAKISTANKKCTIHIRAIPLPDNITKQLNNNIETIKLLVNGTDKEETKSFYHELKRLFDDSDGWEGVVDKIWAFGPGRIGPNILLNKISDYDRPSIWPASFSSKYTP